MDKRYQVFVSSTYADLQDERSKVIQTLMEMDCIPAGMELFPAMDEEQFEFIKKIIDDCDYYLLILGARYGSISEDDGLSYTEKEYRYAQQKGMKIIALVHGAPEQLPVIKTDRDPTLQEKLAYFRNDVCSNRLVKFWTSPAELPGLVALNLPKTIKAYPAIGWVRGDTTASASIMTELLAVKAENDRLQNELLQMTSSSSHMDNGFAGLDYKIKISGGFHRGGEIGSIAWTIDVSLREIFQLISPKLLSPQTDADMRVYSAKQLFTLSGRQGFRPAIIEAAFQTIKVHFEAIGLISLTTDRDQLIWSLTPSGRKVMTELVAIKEQ